MTQLSSNWLKNTCVVLAIAAVQIGCGKSASKLCADGCANQAKCADEAGYGDDYSVSDCESDCEDGFDEAKEEGCGSEAKKFLRCAAKEDSCPDEDSIGNLSCLEEGVDYFLCMPADFGLDEDDGDL